MGCAPDTRNYANELSVDYSQRTNPIDLIRPKTHVLMRFARFCKTEYGRYELGPGCALDARNCANEVYVDSFRTIL